MYKKDKYFGDTRYEAVWEQMQLLGIEDITTKRTHHTKNKIVILDDRTVLTRIIDLKNESWRDYPTFYKIGDYYYV